MRKINTLDFTVASNLTPRHVNRRIILNLLRSEERFSRAELARRTGLQRSTISLIVEELIAENWITESVSSSGCNGSSGRRPILLRLNSNRGRILGIDIKPAVTTLGLADFAGRFLVRESFETIPDPGQFVPELCRRVQSFAERECGGDCSGIGVSVPGRVDLATKRLSFAPNLAWRDIDIKTPLEAATGLTVDIDNEANACSLAELYFRTHVENMNHLIAVTVTEGIGTGIIMDGQLLLGPSGLAGEFGHMTIENDGLPCRCGNHGCWEVYASNLSALRYYKELSDAAPKRSKTNPATTHGRSLITRSGSNRSAGITFSDLLLLSETGDACAIRAVEKMARYLGTGLACLVSGFTPNLIVITGEVTRVWARIAPILEETISSRAVKPVCVKLLPTNEMLYPRLRGAIALVMHRHFGAPLLA